MPHALSVVSIVVALGIGALGFPRLAPAENALGVRLPARAKRLDDGRYLLQKASYGKAVAHFRKFLKRARVEFASTERVHRASVKFTHFRSLDSSTPWEHINVSTYDRRVFVRVLPRRVSER